MCFPERRNTVPRREIPLESASNNVISRLELYYEQPDLLEIYSEGAGKGTEVVIHIPLIR